MKCPETRCHFRILGECMTEGAGECRRMEKLERVAERAIFLRDHFFSETCRLKGVHELREALAALEEQ